MSEWIWNRFKDDLKDVTPEEIDWRPLPQANTINAIVRHLGVEARFHLAEPSQLRRISREIRVNRRGKFFALNKTFSQVFVVETYPLCRGVT